MPRGLPFALLLAGCPTAEPAPPGPPAPELVWIEAPIEATTEPLFSGPTTFAAALPWGRVLFGAADGLWALDPLDPAPRLLASDLGVVTGAVSLGPANALLTTSAGLHTLTDWGVAPSPLASVYAGDGRERIVATPDATSLFFADEAGLARWRDGQLVRLDVGALPTASARLAFGSPVQDRPALWVAADDVVYALVEGGAGLVTWEELDGLGADALAVDGLDDLWVLVRAGSDAEMGAPGDVRRRLPDGGSQWFRLPAPVTALAGGASSSVWMSDGARLWRSALDRWDEVAIDGAPALDPAEELVAVDVLGRLIVQGPEGVRRIAVGRPVQFLGLEPGTPLAAPTTVTVVPAFAARATSITAALDGAPAALVPLDPAGATLLLDPASFSDGPHELAVTVAYDDAPDATASLFFSAGVFVPPTWTGDIAAISSAHCLVCHSTEGGAHLLDTRARWADEIDVILGNVRAGAMPLTGDKLESAQIRQIELWRAGGTPE